MTEHIAHSGTWGIALIVIVVASWFLYRYLGPKTWKEWASDYNLNLRKWKQIVSARYFRFGTRDWIPCLLPEMEP
ncbi:MAG: hypothetical protein ACSLFC_03485 [Desulfuromonadales bacterium]